MYHVYVSMNVQRCNPQRTLTPLGMNTRNKERASTYAVCDPYICMSVCIMYHHPAPSRIVPVDSAHSASAIIGSARSVSRVIPLKRHTTTYNKVEILNVECMLL